jgi:hypothetical protein
VSRPAPTRVDIITYQMGFGDCFLLRFHYPGRTRMRTALIDFGTTKHGGWHPGQVAQQIREDSGGKLDVVAATHRHKDHVDGFTVRGNGRGTGKVIRELEPTAVIMPWTEDPRAEPDAVRPTRKYGAHGPGFVARLLDMQALAGAVERQMRAMRPFAHERALRSEIQALGENNLRNAAAMKNLRTMGRRTYYAFHGMELRLARELPGVKVHVLGPPTLEQTDAIRRQRARHEDEFWHLMAVTAAAASDGPRIFPDAEEVKNPVRGRGLRRRLRQVRTEQLLSIVRSLDHAMNNTSLILLFEVGGKKLLFPGDAQHENWKHALDQDWVRALLSGVDVYKVGHHGSLNATPKSMLELFHKKRSKGHAEVMYSLLSTLEGVHGKEDRKTEVPRTTLVKTLSKETQLVSTLELGEAISKTITLEV